MRLTILGSGTSHGVPELACSCPVCRSPDPRDARWRSSGWLQGEGCPSLLIDSGPEFRLQALRAGIDRLDGILITHAHADHLHGLDDIRPLCRDRVLPLWGDRRTLKEIRERFPYAFKAAPAGGGIPRIELHEAAAPFGVGGWTVVPVPILHGSAPILGWRVGGMAWLTDCSSIPDGSRPLLEGLDVLVLGALRDRRHPTHFSFEEAVEAALGIGARRSYLTHLSHDHGHEEARRIALSYARGRLAPGRTLDIAYDGLSLDID